MESKYNFNGEEEYIEKYFSHEDFWYFGGPSRNFYIKLAFRYYYGLWGTELDIFLKNIGLEHLIQGISSNDNNIIHIITNELFDA